MIGAPGAEWLPPMNPEVQLTPPQLAVQSSPTLAGSPNTYAATVKLAPDGKVVGGGWVIRTPVTVEVIPIVAPEDLP